MKQAQAVKFAAGVMLAVGLAAGCARSAKQVEYERQEKALTLIDQGATLEKDGSVLLALEKYDRAARYYESPVGYFRMGRVFEGQEKNNQAAAAYQEAVRLSPDYQEARFALLALGYRPAEGTPDEKTLAAAQAWAAEHAGEIPRSKVAADDAATTVTDSEEERARLLAEAAEHRVPTQAEVRTVLFSAPKGGTPLPSATDPTYPNNLDVILGTYPYHYHKAQQLNKRLQYEAATLEYERAIQADPKQIDARLDLGDMMMKMGRQPRARYHYEKAMEDFPKSPRPHLKMGNYYLQLKRPEDARAAYRQATEKDPNFVEAYNNMAVMLMQEKKYDEAMKMLDEMVKMQPGYANSYYNRGIIASDVQHDKAKALENYRQYVALNGEHGAQVQKWIEDLEKQQ